MCEVRNTVSDMLQMKNGLRQCSLLSPFLLSVYIADLIDKVVQSKIDCNIGGLFVNILAYADDIVILAPSWSALQVFLNICAQCSVELDIVLNVSKSVCKVLFCMILER